MEIVAYLATALLYGALAIYFWRTRWATSPAAAPQSALSLPDTPSGVSRAAEHYAVLVPLAMHGAILGGSLFAGEGLHLGVANAVSAIVWLTVLIYWVGNFFYRLDGLQALVLPLAAVAVLLPALMPPARAVPNTELAAFKFHLLIA